MLMMFIRMLICIGDLGVAHAAEKGRARVVQREEGVTQGRYFKVQDTGVQHVRVDGAVAGADYGPGKEDAEHRVVGGKGTTGG